MGTPARPGCGRLVKAVRGWPLFQLAPLLRWYIIAVTAAATAATAAAASTLPFAGWQLADFAVLLGCGLGSVVATRRINYPRGTAVRDLLTVWVLPVAISLPPLYALIVPWPLLGLTQLYDRRAVVHRRVFTAAAIGLAYGGASWLFRALPGVIAGPSPGSAAHAVGWFAAVAVCDVGAWAVNNVLLAVAIKASDRTAKISDLFGREALSGDYVQWAFAVVVTFFNAMSPALTVFCWPLVMLQRRVLMHQQLVSRARIEPKTGLLNAAAWDREATVAIARAHRTGAPLAVALIDLDVFKDVNDTYGHLNGDKVLRAVGDRLRNALRPDDVPGRFGGDEFCLLLPGAPAEVAHRVAERLRVAIACSPIAIGTPDRPGSVEMTVSIGVATLTRAEESVTELLAAADAAMYEAKANGRNCICVVTGTSRRVSGPSGAEADEKRGIPPAAAG
jgi:diguanylate cyclase (GGDEF)-like protein